MSLNPRPCTVPGTASPRSVRGSSSPQAGSGAGPHRATPLPAPLPGPARPCPPPPAQARPGRRIPSPPVLPAPRRCGAPALAPLSSSAGSCGIPGVAGPAASGSPRTARAAAIAAVPALSPEASAVRRGPLSGPSSGGAAMPAARAGPRRAALRPQHRGGPCAMSRPPLGTFSAPLASSSHGATLLLRPLSLPASSPPFPALHAGAGAARHSGSSPAADMATLTAVQPLTLDRGKRCCRRSPAAPARPPCPGGHRGERRLCPRSSSAAALRPRSARGRRWRRAAGTRRSAGLRRAAGEGLRRTRSNFARAGAAMGRVSRCRRCGGRRTRLRSGGAPRGRSAVPALPGSPWALPALAPHRGPASPPPQVALPGMLGGGAESGTRTSRRERRLPAKCGFLGACAGVCGEGIRGRNLLVRMQKKGSAYSCRQLLGPAMENDGIWVALRLCQ